MTIKRMMLLASMALAAVAFAAPATASAENLTFLHNHQLLEGKKSQAFQGPLTFVAPGASFRCDVTVVFRAEGVGTAGEGHTGTVTNFEPITETCEGEGALAGCNLVEHDATNLPWVTHTTTNGMVVTNAEIHNIYDANCPVPTSHLHFPEVTVTADENTTINTLSISTVDTSGAVTAHGVVHREGAATFGIG